MSLAVEMHNVFAGYATHPVLMGIDLNVSQGEMMAVLGPNGAGKSTLFKVLTGLIVPTAGFVNVFGQSILDINAAERAKLIGVVPQNVQTPVAFSVEEMVMIGRTASLPRWSKPTAHDMEIVERSISYTDIGEIRSRPFTDLSGGEKQRTIIAMALAQEPRLILMDEATSHLDINHRFEVMHIVERLNRDAGVTVIIVSHDIHLAADFCRRLVVIDHGRLVADGTPTEVLTDDLLGKVYHCDVHVLKDPTSGTFTVIPSRRMLSGSTANG